MRVLMLVPDYPPFFFGGIGTYAYLLVNELVSSGVEMDVFVVPIKDRPVTEEFDTELWKTEDGETYPVRRFRSAEPVPEWNENLESNTLHEMLILRSSANAVTGILRFVRDRHYDVIHANDFFVGFLAEALRDALKIPIVNTVHAGGFLEQSVFFQLRKYTCLMADRNVIVSRSAEDVLNYDWQLLRVEFTPVLNGVSLRPETADEILSEGHDIVMVGRISQSKGNYLMLKVFLQMLRDRELPEDSRLIFVGNSDELPALKAVLEEKGAADRVLCPGTLDNDKTRDLMHHAWITAALGDHETFGLTALEAMAENTCVITSDCGAFPEYLTDGKDCLMVKLSSADSLRTAILRIINEPDLRHELIRNGRETVRRLSWRRTAEQMTGIFQEAIDAWKANGNRSVSFLNSRKKKKKEFDLRQYLEDMESK
ncbi:MAG: glycosyltransferase family 4 protein [Eubacteriales bacterium]|nr:glycosyltransferase family 4 protein [Eubacteriales bacterium]